MRKHVGNTNDFDDNIGANNDVDDILDDDGANDDDSCDDDGPADDDNSCDDDGSASHDSDNACRDDDARSARLYGGEHAVQLDDADSARHQWLLLHAVCEPVVFLEVCL